MLIFISPYATEILGVVTEKVTAKALWEVIGIAQNPIHISPSIKSNLQTEKYILLPKKEKENAQDIISSWINVILATI
tara:strand:- start:179 stop:412 length:234 start_codon:yes stop_codon:yes gene_type:complete